MAAYRKRKPYAKKATKRKPYAKKVTKSRLNKTIRKVVSRMAETKIQNIDGTVSLGGFSATNWNTTNVIPLSIYSGFLQIAQGTGQGDRIGDKVTITNLMLRLIFTPRPYSASNLTPIPQMIKLFLVNARAVNQYNLRPTQANMNQFFQEGNSSAGPSDNLFDMIEEVNKDLWNVYATKTIKLGSAAYDGTGGSANAQYYTNNDYKFNHLIRWNITKHIPKICTWNDTSVSATSRGLFLVVLTANADGSTPASSSILPSTMNYDLTMSYKDM